MAWHMSTRLRPIGPGSGSLMPQMPHMSADLLGLVVVSVPGEALESALARAADVIMNECAPARGVGRRERPGDLGVVARPAPEGAGGRRLVREEARRGAVRPDGVER